MIMTRNSNAWFRLFSLKSITSIFLVLSALILPACGVGEEEGVYEEEVGEEEGFGEEEGLGDDEEMDEEEVGESE
jgi:hypothetical protein